MPEPTQIDFPEYLDEAVEIWDEVSEWWDSRIGDGNEAQDFLIEPTQEKLLDLQPNDKVLDIACGAGRFTRRMADQGVQIVALDHSRNFIQLAKDRSKGYEGRIQFHVANAADRDALLDIQGSPFDAAVCTMGLMDMAVITPLAETLPSLLKPNGKFVFSVTHPVFNSNGTRNSMEREFTENGVVEDYRVSVPTYSVPSTYLGVGINGQPRAHRYFHRPISDLFQVFLQQGFALTALEEPRFPPKAQEASSSKMSGEFWWHFPLILVARLELLGE